MSGAISSLLLLGAGFMLLLGESKQTKRLVLGAVATLLIGPHVEQQLGQAAGSTLPVVATIVSVVLGLIILGLLTLGAMRLLESRRQRALRPNLTVRRREVDRQPEPWQADAQVPQANEDDRDDLGLLG